MTALRHMAPLSSIALLVLFAALPWGLPSQDRFFLPLLPVVAIHYWTLRQPQSLPEWSVFLAGVALDILTHGPLGYWPLIYLLAYVAACFSAPLADKGAAARLGLLAAALLAVAAAGWATASLYFFEFADWRPYGLGAALAAVCAVPLLAVLRSLDVERRVRHNPRLVRGV